MKPNNFTVNYTKKTLVLHFEGEKFTWNLNDGDVGDFWHSFTTKKGIIKDINFYQEDAGERPNLSVYGVKKAKGGLLIDTNDEICIKDFKQAGNPVKYFGESDEDEDEDDKKSCDNCGSTNGYNNSSDEFQCNNCGHSETE
jgi:hypothetical protein